MIELRVVDLVRSLSLEPLVDEFELLLARVQLEVVHDLAEAGHRNETATALVLILEERLN